MKRVQVQVSGIVLKLEVKKAEQLRDQLQVALAAARSRAEREREQRGGVMPDVGDDASEARDA